MDGTERRRLSTRSLAVIVAASILVALAIMVTLVALVAFGPEFVRFPSGSAAPTVTVVLATSQPAPEPAAAIEKGVSTGWNSQGTEPTPSPLLAKPIVPGGQALPMWTATPAPTNTPTPSPTPNPTFVSSAYGLGDYMPDGIDRNERWVDVDLSTQTLVAYEGLVPVFETLVSTGTASHPTVTGQFRIWLRFRAQDMDGYRLGYNYYLRNVPYVQYFYEDYALHGTFWHSNFGQPMSHGCVNLATPDAEWLYNWAGYGTLVNVHP
ncbi:MAG: L,D-transpeptidase [Candidatus Promineifilaceae bacterium]